MNIHRKKASQYFKTLKYYLKALYLNIQVLWNIIWSTVGIRQEQGEMTKQIENTYFTKPPYCTQAQQNMKVLNVAAEAVLTQTLKLMSSPDFWEEFLSILINTQPSVF